MSETPSVFPEQNPPQNPSQNPAPPPVERTSAPPEAVAQATEVAKPRIDGLAFVMDIEVRVTVEMGRKHAKISDILKLETGSILELDKASGEPLDVFVNDRLVARGQAVVVGERYGIRILEVLVDDVPGALGAQS